MEGMHCVQYVVTQFTTGRVRAILAGSENHISDTDSSIVCGEVVAQWYLSPFFVSHTLELHLAAKTVRVRDTQSTLGSKYFNPGYFRGNYVKAGSDRTYRTAFEIHDTGYVRGYFYFYDFAVFLFTGNSSGGHANPGGSCNAFDRTQQAD